MSPRARWIAALALSVVTAALLLGALAGGYASRAFLDADRFADRAAAALDREAVADEVAARATAGFVSTDPDLLAVRPVIEEVIAGLVRSGAFQDVFRAAARDLHRAVFERDQATVTFTLADLGATARGALQALDPKLARQIPPAADVSLLTDNPPSFVVEAAKLRELPWILLGLGGVCAFAAVWISPDRRRAVVALGIATVVAGAAGVVALAGARAVLLGEVQAGSPRDAGAAIWDAFLGDLRTAMLLFAACGAVVTAAGSSLLRPVQIGEPLARAWGAVATVPERPALRILRALALVAAGALLVIFHELALDTIAILAGLYVAWAGTSELMRMTLAAPSSAADPAAGRRAPLVAALVTALVILGAGALFISTGGDSEQAPAVVTEGCNGSEELCDAKLERVAFAATHNSMSAASHPNWLFAQQEAGFPQQLAAGVRGLMIDAHYGQPTESGTVKTDLSELDRGERATYEAELGSDALDAALRIRDRIVRSPATGSRQVYLCHRFCELGAYPIERAFGQIRDFLAADPNAVLMIVVEDYVDPAAIADAAENTGLLEYVYTRSVDDPLPTLGEMVESGGRVLMLAENDDGGGTIPWYHLAYDGLVQETPFSFSKPGQLIDESRLPASCEPNRGPADAPLFLVNHWIDTSPAPRPSNARKVNAREALLGRVHECERLRGLTAGLVAVDFYREGDLFGVVDQLNREWLAAER